MTNPPTIDWKVIKEELSRLSSDAYCHFIALSSRTECLGWKAKVANGKFGKPELDAHTRAWEALGKHRAYNHILTEVTKVEALNEED
jgi:hypothetical protein